MFKRRKSPPSEAAPPPEVPKTRDQIDREALRAKHNVRPLTDAEDGFGVDRLPDGVYGFTYAPGLPSAPLFGQRAYHSFEMHKLADGNLLIVGFVPPATADLVNAGQQTVALRLFPDPEDEAVQIVGIPVSRVARMQEYSARQGKGLETQVAPAQQRVTAAIRYEETGAW